MKYEFYCLRKFGHNYNKDYWWGGEHQGTVTFSPVCFKTYTVPDTYENNSELN